MTLRARAAVRTASSAALAVAALAALAGCAAGATGSTAAPADADASAPAASGSASSSAASGASGTWTETGAYQTPGGPESVEVTLKVQGGTVETVAVKGSGGTPNSQRYQGQFISGVSAAVVGKPLATLKVGAVSGSSLTGQGFNAAVEKIRADAA